MKRFGLSLLIALVLVDCGGGDGGNGPPTITAVIVSGDSTVVLNGTRQLTATAMAGNTSVVTGITFQWTSSNGTTASVSSAGLVSGSQLGSVTITAQAVLNGTATGVVSSPKSMRVRIGSIGLTPSAPQFPSLGDTVVMTAEARDFANARVTGVTFSFQSRTPGVATATATSATQANVVAVANGTTRVVVSGDGVSDSVTATVQQVATSLSITPDTTTFTRIGATLTPTVTATDARGNPLATSAIGWTSQNTAAATVNATTGVITSVNEGQSRVIGTSGSLADTVRVGVGLVYKSVDIATTGGLPAPIDSGLITRLNGTLQLGLIVQDSGNTVVPNPQGIAWSLKHSGTVATIDAATGLVTGNANTGRDTVVLVARTVRDSVPLVVRQDVASIAVTPASPQDLNFVSDTQRFIAEPRDAGGSAIPGKTIAWSTGRLILGIDASGLAHADSATSETGIVVKVEAATDGVTDSSVSIRVRQVPNSATLSPSSFGTLTAFGRTATASCVVKDSAAVTIPGHPCTWSADVTGVITFSPTIAATTTITAVGNGSATIKATYFLSLFAPNFIQVDQIPATVTVTPTNLATNLQLRFSQTAPFSAVVRDTLGNIAAADPVTWSTTNATVADVNPTTGVVTTATTAGSVTITATATPASTGRTVDVVATGQTLSGSVQPILTTNCTGSACHDLTGPQAGMTLVSGQTFGSTVDQMAEQLASMRRVRPFRPDSSYLVHKIQGTQASVGGSGVRMPEGCSGGSCLPNATIDIIRNWILQGALNN